jgi:hypothetical protein
MNRVLTATVSVALIAMTVACGGGAPASQPAATPAAPAAAPAAPAEAPKPTGTLSLLEPLEGAMGGHIDMFRWSPVEGADGYVIKITAVTGDRVVWESPVMTATETKLPATVALEPEPHVWNVTARKAGQTLVTSATQKFTITP